MADNVAITAGSGTDIATDQVTGTLEHVQLVKLAYSADGVRTLVTADANGILVDLGANNDVAVSSVPSDPFGANADAASATGSISAKLRYLAATGLAGMTALPAGGNTIGDVTISGSALTALQLIDDPVFADDAAFTVATSKVQATGGYCVAHGSSPDAADAGDAGIFLLNRHRIPFVLGGHPNIQTLRVNYTTAQTDTAIVTIGSGSKIVVTQIMIVVDTATTATPSCIVGFGTANTPTGAGVVVSHPGIAGGGGVSRGDGSGILGVGADNEDLRVTCAVPTGGSISIIVSYFTIET